MGWILRILLLIAAPIAAMLVARDTLNFEIVQTFVAIILIIAFIGLGVAWSARGPRKPS